MDVNRPLNVFEIGKEFLENDYQDSAETERQIDGKLKFLELTGPLDIPEVLK